VAATIAMEQSQDGWLFTLIYGNGSPPVKRLKPRPLRPEGRFQALCSIGQGCRVGHHWVYMSGWTAWCWTLLQGLFLLCSFSGAVIN
jgi:hypothetical protein